MTQAAQTGSITTRILDHLRANAGTPVRVRDIAAATGAAPASIGGILRQKVVLGQYITDPDWRRVQSVRYGEWVFNVTMPESERRLEPVTSPAPTGPDAPVKGKRSRPGTVIDAVLKYLMDQPNVAHRPSRIAAAIGAHQSSVNQILSRKSQTSPPGSPWARVKHADYGVWIYETEKPATPAEWERIDVTADGLGFVLRGPDSQLWIAKPLTVS